ncbi:MAG TPA: cytochrome c1 [Geminicoccaceae bacterium]|nr:cytochrome c1 [Geminicoccaceae bacterium]
MLRTMVVSTLILGGLCLVKAAPAGAQEEAVPLQRNWSFEGLFGTYDRSAAQRGLQVYREVCQNCHGLKYVAFRNLEALGFTEDEVSAIAAEYQITDGPNDEGEMYERPGRPSDRFPSPFPNDQAARLANGGALPPDLSLITKAREDGSNYVYSLLQGYEEPPPGEQGLEGLYYNAYFPNHWIAMPPPLSDGQVTFADGSSTSVEQMASDVATFLTWTAEPMLEARKQTGLKVLLFLVVLTGLFYASKRRIWASAH